MIRLAPRFNAPIHAGAEIVLQIGRPAFERVVAVGGAMPDVAGVGPKIIWAERLEFRAHAEASCPTAPGGLQGIVHAGRDEIQEGVGVALLLPERGVGGVERAESTMAGEHVALEIEAAGSGRE